MAFGFPPLPTPALNESPNRGRPTLGATWVRFLREMYKLRPTQGSVIDGGQLIEDQALTPFADNTITHSLGRTPKLVIPTYKQGVSCSFEAYSGSTQSVAGSAEIVQIDTESYDRGSDFDVSTYKFTAPAQGLYEFSGQVALSAIADTKTATALLYKNDSLVYVGSNSINGAAGDFRSRVSGQMELAANDTVSLYVSHNDATRSTRAGLDDTRLSGRLIRDAWIASIGATSIVFRTTYAHTVSLWIM